MDTRTREQFFECVCRTCMHDLVEEFSFNVNFKPEQRWHSLFDKIEECEFLPAVELLSTTVPQIEVHLNDELPKKICRKCLERMQSIFRFQQMCLQSDKHMRNLIASGNVDVKVMTTDGSFENETKPNDFLAQEYFVNATEQRIDAETVNALPETLNSSAAADPLQADDSRCEIIEPCNNDESNGKDREDEAPLTAFSIKLEEVKRETDAKQNNFSATNNCSLCNKSFKGPRALKAHLRCHKKMTDNKLPKYTCEICNKTYDARRSLTRHTNIRHSIEKPTKIPKKPAVPKPNKTQKKHLCEICDKTFTRSTTLREHLLIHTNTERSYLCPECGKAFAKESHLKNHCLRHSDVAAFECPHCPKRFRTRNDVSKHKVIHQEIKKHICDVCGDRFVKRHQLTVHKRYHTGIKPYKCDYCDMRFVSKYNNRLHMRTHTGEKPYQCKYCERAFAQSNDHMKHLRTHIGDNVYRCELCPSAFRLASELRVHFATHKNEDGDTREQNLKALKEAEARLQLKLAKKQTNA
ncbi:zinc finger protein 429-like isoform X1 [Eurosta solidaginis]|uniref:zinc finger protein 429-like isoform X1 n=1 Tax=Eurosta solidaginis TaxID=178769 RepID=UPI003530A7EF